MRGIASNRELTRVTRWVVLGANLGRTVVARLDSVEVRCTGGQLNESTEAGAAGENPAEEPALTFWVSPDEDDDGDAMGMFWRDGDAVLRKVPLGPLRKNLTETVTALQEVFADVAAQGGTLPLREAQLQFQVTASGGIQLVGSSQVQGTRAITLVFRQ